MTGTILPNYNTINMMISDHYAANPELFFNYLLSLGYSLSDANRLAQTFSVNYQPNTASIFNSLLSMDYSLADAKKLALTTGSMDYLPPRMLSFLVHYLDVRVMESMENTAQLHSAYCPLTLKLIGQTKYNMLNSSCIPYSDFRRINGNITLLDHDLEMLRDTVRNSPILSQLYDINIDNKVKGQEGLANSNMLLCSEAFKHETQAAFDRLKLAGATAASETAAKAAVEAAKIY